MPFTKTSGGNYKSKSGRLYTPDQLKLYYATKGFKRKPRRKTQ